MRKVYKQTASSTTQNQQHFECSTKCRSSISKCKQDNQTANFLFIYFFFASGPGSMDRGWWKLWRVYIVWRVARPPSLPFMKFCLFSVFLYLHFCSCWAVDTQLPAPTTAQCNIDGHRHSGRPNFDSIRHHGFNFWVLSHRYKQQQEQLE